MEEFWRVDPGCGCVLLAAFGAEYLQNHGTSEQKEKYLPPIPTGEAIMGAASPNRTPAAIFSGQEQQL